MEERGVFLRLPAGSRLLLLCGLTRITWAGELSRSFLGEAHDGEYPLRRYTRVADIQ